MNQDQAEMCNADACFQAAEMTCDACSKQYCWGHAKHPDHHMPLDR
jgi:hypothetical protein